jgi:hypothetical protein
MSRLLNHNSTLVYPDYGMFQITDQAHYEFTAPVPGRNDFSAGEHSVYLRSSQTHILVHLELESWDSEPPRREEDWEGWHTAVIRLETGVLDVNEITAGSQPNVLTLPGPGRYRVRAAHRNRHATSEAYWELSRSGAEPGEIKRALEGKEQHLAQFWPEQ